MVRPWVAAGKVRAVIGDTFPLLQAADAHAWMDGDHVGKVVLTVG